MHRTGRDFEDRDLSGESQTDHFHTLAGGLVGLERKQNARDRYDAGHVIVAAYASYDLSLGSWLVSAGLRLRQREC